MTNHETPALALAQYTTPSPTIRVYGVDLTPYDVMVSIRQEPLPHHGCPLIDIDGGEVTLTKDGDDTLLQFSLTQEQTGRLYTGIAAVQVNYGSGSARMATSICTARVTRNLRDGTVEFERTTDPDTTDGEIGASICTMPPKGSITSEYLADGAVESRNIGKDAVTEDAMAPDSVGKDQIKNGSVGADKLDVTLKYEVEDGDLTISLE